MAESPVSEHPHLSSPSDTAIDGEDTDILSPPLSSLREISTLASWTVSTYKPGCGVSALRNPSPTQFWQSDGPQPHLLNVHFFKLVSIARLRVYLDLDADESYTPTRMQFLAGHSEYDVVEFAEWRAPGTGNPGEDQTANSRGAPKGWVDIGLERCWGRGSGGLGMDEDDGGADGEGEGEGVLRCMFLQIKVLENHQNGKDTHIRGVQIWARDEREGKTRNFVPAAAATAAAAAIAAGGANGSGKDSKRLGIGRENTIAAATAENYGGVWDEEVESWIEDGFGDGVIR